MSSDVILKMNHIRKTFPGVIDLDDIHFAEVQALFSCNDNMALGAIEAIAAAGRTGDIIVVGFDAIDDARLAIQKGAMEGSLAQYPSEIGKLGVEYAYQLLNGEDIPEYVATKIELITKEKLDKNE